MYLGFFEFVHNIRRRGRALLGSLLDTLLQPVACPQTQYEPLLFLPSCGCCFYPAAAEEIDSSGGGSGENK